MMKKYKGYESPAIEVINLTVEQAVFVGSVDAGGLSYGGSAWEDTTTTPSSSDLGGLSDGGSAWTTTSNSVYSNRTFELSDKEESSLFQ